MTCQHCNQIESDYQVLRSQMSDIANELSRANDRVKMLEKQIISAHEEIDRLYTEERTSKD